MEPPIPDFEPSAWSFPEWIQAHMVPDGRFARAYNCLGDERRALIKSLIAQHFILNPPKGALHTVRTDRFGLLERSSVRGPAPFALLLTDAGIEAPALFLASLLPALCARVPEVLAVRLGKRRDVPDSLLVACELSGQERLATLGPVQIQRLLLECSSCGEPGVVLYPDSLAYRRLLAKPSLCQALQASPLRLVPLRAPRVAGLWRDTSLDFPPEDVSLLYGGLSFDIQGAVPGQRVRKAQDESAWQTFSSVPRDLLLVPASRAGQGRAAVTVSGECLGLWRWPELHSGTFVHERQIYTST